MPYPSILVKNFARIKEAEVELAPLTLLVGNNNSGKSYLSSLIWGFYQSRLPFHLFEADYNKCPTGIIPDDTILQWIKKGLREGLHNDVIQVPENTQRIFQETINTLLHRHKEKLIRFVFRRKIDIDHLSLKLPCNPKLQFQMSLHPDPRLFYDDQEDRRQVRFTVGKTGRGMSLHNIKDPRLPHQLYRALLESYFLSYFCDTCSFFPASRSGFLLTYKSIVDKALKRDLSPRLKSENRKNSQLTAPQSTFLRNLAKSRDRMRETRSSKTQSLIDFIEQNMIGGALSINDLPVADLLYRPEGLESDLPMFLSSGVVTEIVPLLAHLKFDYMDNRSVVEEPEMSLHPELQRRMAQVLIRLSKILNSVLVTTHSDLIIQHINNMVKLAHRKDGKKLAKEHGYINEDIISDGDVRMYQFDVEHASRLTTVQKLESNANGFSVPTFGNALRTSRKDVIAFYNDDEQTTKKRG